MSVSFLLQRFTEFYRQVANIKTRILAVEAAEKRGETPDPNAERLTRKTITDKLLLLLDRQQAQMAGSANSPGARL